MTNATGSGPGGDPPSRSTAPFGGLAVVVLLIALVATACGGSGESGEDPESGPIKIGIIADLTGPFTTYGTSLANSAQLAIKEINDEGGIAGRPIEVIVEDIQTDVTATVEKSRKLVETDDVDVVIGPIGSDANDAAFKTVAVDGGTLLFYTETYEGGKCHELFFSFGAVPAQQIRPMIPLLQERFGTDAMLFGADYVWPRRSFEIAAPIIDENGGTVASELYLPLIAEDFTEFVQEVRNSEPSYIFSLYPAIWGAALKALDDAGLLEGQGVFTTFLGDPDYQGIAELAEGSYTALPFFTVADGPGVAEFLTAYEAEYGKGAIPSGGESMGAYNSVYLYKTAVEQAGTTDANAVADALVGLKHEGPTGTVEMMPSHHLKQTIYVVNAVDGRYELVDSFPGQDPEEDCSP